MTEILAELSPVLMWKVKRESDEAEIFVQRKNMQPGIILMLIVKYKKMKIN